MAHSKVDGDGSFMHSFSSKDDDDDDNMNDSDDDDNQNDEKDDDNKVVGTLKSLKTQVKLSTSSSSSSKHTPSSKLLTKEQKETQPKAEKFAARKKAKQKAKLEVREVATGTSTAITPDPAETKPAKRQKRKHDEDLGAGDATLLFKNPSVDTDNNHELNKVKKKKKKKNNVSKQTKGQEDDDDNEDELSSQSQKTKTTKKKSQGDTMKKEKLTVAKSRTENKGDANVGMAENALAAASKAVEKTDLKVDKWDKLVELNLDNPKKLSACLEQRDFAITERDKAMIERDKAMIERDKAMIERDKAMIERDKATAVEKAELKVDKWDKLVELNLDNPKKLSVCLEQRDFAITERDKAVSERDKARAFYLKLAQNDHQEAFLDVAALEAKERARNFVAVILKDDTLEAIPNSNGMKVMRNVPDLETGKASVTLVVRNITDKFWQACIETVATEGQRVCAVGTPGIGKTSATPYLIRMLLKNGNRVVYLIRSDDESSWFYEFIPTNDNNSADVAVYTERQRTIEIPSLRDASTYYIVDQGMTETNCVPNFFIKAKFILVSSPYNAHWGRKEFQKIRHDFVGIFHYYPIWTLEELKQASTFLKNNLTEEEMHDRYRKFGGVPRIVFQKRRADFKEQSSSQQEGLASLTADMVKRLYLEKLAGVATFSSRTKSAVIGLNSSEERKFLDGVPILISDLVYEEVGNKYITNLWNIMASDEEHGRTWYEAYTRLQMTLPNQSRDFIARSCVGLSDNAFKEMHFMVLGGCSSIRLVVDIVDAAKKRQGDLFYSNNKMYPLIDFIYQDTEGVFHAFQATLGKTHDADPTKIKALEKQIHDAKNKLRLYYLVPAEKFGAFVTTPVKPNVSCRVYHVMVPNPEEEQTHKPLKAVLNDEVVKRLGEKNCRPVEEEDFQPAGSDQ